MLKKNLKITACLNIKIEFIAHGFYEGKEMAK